ncbi:WXG100 family type VII secretion target [Actinosynnema sp. CA-248983]
MAGYTTGTPELIQAAKDIISVDESVQGILGQVRSTVDGVSASWAGQAATAFQTLMTRFDEDARKLQEALRGIAEQISGTAEIYARQEEEQNQSMSSLTSRLAGGF